MEEEEKGQSDLQGGQEFPCHSNSRPEVELWVLIPAKAKVICDLPFHQRLQVVMVAMY